MPIIVDPTPERDCRPPWIYSERAGGCVKLRPRPQRRDNIAWIQACLNSLGFNAGPEDGIAGSRTRGAWDDFRAAQGLDGFANYNNPETLAMLYQRCDPSGDKNPVMPKDPPKDDPPGDDQPGDDQPGDDQPRDPPADQTGASGLKYQSPACATGPMYELLKAELGDEIELEKCGTSCIPVPNGITEEQALKMQNEQGVNWCKHCITFGDGGLLCPSQSNAKQDDDP